MAAPLLLKMEESAQKYNRGLEVTFLELPAAS